MVYSELINFFDQHCPLWSQSLLIAVAVALIVLLGYVLLFPFINKKQELQSVRIHAVRTTLPDLTHIEKPGYRKIAMASEINQSYLFLKYKSDLGNHALKYLLVKKI